jgi:hypothetical protein
MDTLRLTIDTCCINAYGGEANVTILERWQQEGKLELVGTERLLQELARGRNEKRKEKARRMKNVGEPFVLEESVFDSGAHWSGSPAPSPMEIASVLFQRRFSDLKPSDVGDILHLLAHHDGGSAIFVTNNSRHFIDGGRQQLLKERWAIEVMTPAEVVTYLRQQYNWT